MRTLLLSLFVAALVGSPLAAAEIKGSRIVCEDGTEQGWNPFKAAGGSPAFYCGETAELVSTDPTLTDVNFELIFGIRPTAQTSELRGDALRLARQTWDLQRQAFGGIVEPEVLQNPLAASNPEALVDAVAAGLFPANFTPAVYQERINTFHTFVGGRPIVYLTFVRNRNLQAVRWVRVNNKIVKEVVPPNPGFKPVVAFLGLTGGVTAQPGLRGILDYPGIVITQIQIKQIRAGVDIPILLRSGLLPLEFWDRDLFSN